MLKTMVFKPFQRKFQDRYTGPWGVIEPLPGNCYRIQETEDSKPQIVHHDRLKPYRARNVEEHNTDWVKRVKARYAAIRSEPPRMPVPPSTGEDSQQNNSDTEHELLRTVGPYDSDDTDVEESCGVPVDDARETVHSKSDTPSPAKHSEVHDDVSQQVVTTLNQSWPTSAYRCHSPSLTRPAKMQLIAVCYQGLRKKATTVM